MDLHAFPPSSMVHGIGYEHYFGAKYLSHNNLLYFVSNVGDETELTDAIILGDCNSLFLTRWLEKS